MIKRVGLYVILGGIGVLGSVLIAAAHGIPWDTAREITKEFGVALFISAVLGVTVDQGLKTEFAKDVFYAAFRYVLPDELKSEVRPIIDYRLMFTDHRVIVDVVPINGELVRVKVSLERTIKNIARSPQDVFNQLAVDEWGFAEHKSSIDECFMAIGGERIPSEPDPTYSRGDAVGRITKKRQLASQQTARLVSKGSEVHRINGHLLMYFIHPTDRPSLEVRVPDGFRHSAGFGVPGEIVQASEISDHYRLNGTQFPGQAMRVRWWRADANSSVPVTPSEVPPV